MLSINTNLSSLMVQSNLNKSTNALNQAIERMTTGFKINNASDNAANYSITTDMSSKISSYQVAEENTSMAIDLVQTVSSNLDLLYSLGSRLRYLAEQAQNGTYGKESLNAINVEAQSIAKEISRIQANTSYNGIDLFNFDIAKSITNDDNTIGLTEKAGLSENIEQINLTPNSNGFIKDIEVRDTSSMSKLSVISEDTDISSGEYSINSAADLAKLATMVNSGRITGGEFVLSSDIDLSDYQSGEGWNPIGNADNHFKGTFDGNGFKISNLKINRQNADSDKQGLFGTTAEGSEIKNVGVIDSDINVNSRTGALVGCNASNISNCYSTGKIEGSNRLGGLIGTAGGTVYTVDSCYSTCNIIGSDGDCGGLIGITASNVTIKNCYATGDVLGTECVGGLIGYANDGTDVKNNYATGNVSGNSYLGGLIGWTNDGINVKNNYATGDVSGTKYLGGLIGVAYTGNNVTNNFATGDVLSKYFAGGLIGYARTISVLDNCSSSSNVYGISSIGGIIGNNNSETGLSLSISNSFTTGTVNYIGDNSSSTITGDFKNAVQKRDTSGMTKLSSVDPNEMLAAGTYSISTAEELAKLATMQNSGKITAETCEFVLANDIDLSDYTTGTGWTPIGIKESYSFQSIFDGNGYTINNLYINKSTAFTGLFGATHSGAEIKNLGLKNVDITTKKSVNYTGAIAGYTLATIIENCWAEGNVKGTKRTGGIVGWANNEECLIKDCNFKGNVSGTENVGGLTGRLAGVIDGCYIDATVTGTGENVGNITAKNYGTIYYTSSSSGEKYTYSMGIIVGETGDDRPLNIENVGYFNDANSDISLYGGESESVTQTNVIDISDRLKTTFQVGIDGSSSSQISTYTKFSAGGLCAIAANGLEKQGSIELIDMYLSKITSKQTELGAVENRLLSAEESIGVAFDNIISSNP